MNRFFTKHYPIFIIVFITLSALIMSCGGSEEAYKPPEMVKEIFPVAEDSIKGGEGWDLNSAYTSENKPLIETKNDEVLINTININLDLDKTEEQILVLKKRDDPDGPISIAVADYDNVKNEYTRSWEMMTGAANIRSFIVYLDDLIGDHNREIVCSGLDSKGKSTLDVYWKSNTGSNNLLSYTPIFNLSEQGTIEIVQQERSRAYQQGLKDGVSYTITVRREQQAGDGSLDLIQSDYYWDFPLKKYVKLNDKIIESKTVMREQLAEVYRGSREAFYDFLEGPWYKSGKKTGGDDLIIFFDSDAGLITLYTENIQENYTWVDSHKTLSDTLYIRCRNEIINYIENEFYIKINSLNEISITVRDIDSQTMVKSNNDIWSNIYTRMNREQQERRIKKADTSRESDLPVLSGQYISDSGDIIEFYGSDFYMKNSYEDISGGFAVYKSDYNILSMKIINEAGIVTENRTYAFEFSEEEKELVIERILVIRPGRMSIYGFKPSDTEFYRFIQIETRELQQQNTENQ